MHIAQVREETPAPAVSGPTSANSNNSDDTEKAGRPSRLGAFDMQFLETVILAFSLPGIETEAPEVRWRSTHKTAGPLNYVPLFSLSPTFFPDVLLQPEQGIGLWHRAT
jgi:hypothetical protein